MSRAKAVVTGATNGIGEAIARRLAGEGLTVVLVGRDWGRLRAAQQRIHATVPDADLALERADFTDLGEVRELAERLIAVPPPDVVVSNAALVSPLERRTPQGLPRVLAVNHLAPYLLLRALAEAGQVQVREQPQAFRRIFHVRRSRSRLLVLNPASKATQPPLALRSSQRFSPAARVTPVKPESSASASPSSSDRFAPTGARRT